MQRATGHYRGPARSRSGGLGTARVSRRALGHRGGDDGVTLIEVLVAGVVLLLVMIPMGILLTNVTSAADQARQRQAAQQLADSWIQVLSNSNIGPPTSGGAILTNSPTLLTSATTAQVGVPALSDANGFTQSEGTIFKSEAKYTENLVNSVGQSDLCTAGSPPSPTHPGVIQLQVTVKWGHGLANSLSEVTEINYPKPGVQTQGFIAITISNTQEQDVLTNGYVTRLEATPVTLTQTAVEGGGSLNLSPNPYVLYPDLNGCIFAQVPAGTYTVAAGQPGTVYPGYTDTPVLTGYSGPPLQPAFVSTANVPTDQQTTQTVTVTSETLVQLGEFDEGINVRLNYAGASAIDAGVQCPNGAGLTCVTTGDGPSGASAAWGGASSAWSSGSLGAGTHVNQVDCTNASPSKCVAVGYRGGNGLIDATTSNLAAVSADSVPAGVTDLTQVTCPSTAGCYAVGTRAGGPVLLAGRVANGGDTWRDVTPAVAFTAINSVACAASTTCELSYATATGAGVLRLDGDPASLGGNPSWTPTTTLDTLPSSYTVASVGTLTCPSATECLGTAVGDAASPTDGTVVAATIAASGASTWAAEATFPTGATSVTGISCTGGSCVAIGSASANSVGTAAVWTGDLTAAPDNWVQSNGIPPSVSYVSSVACGQPASGDSAACVIGAESASGAASGQLLVGSLTSGSWAWNPVVPPSGATVQYYEGVACENPPSNSAATCAAVGATATGPIVLATSTGPKGSWSVQTPSNFAGNTVDGIPVQVAPSPTFAWSTPSAYQFGATSNPSVVPKVLYPQANGYAVSAGDCSNESGVNTSITAVPGGTTTATVPLGLLALRLVNANGTPAVGATLTLQATSCAAPYDTYNMPVTDATGTSINSVPYGTYTYSVTIGGVVVAPTNLSLLVGPTSVTVTNSISGGTTTQALPGVVQVPA